MDRQYYPALRGRFGDWDYYSCLMPLRDVVSRIGFAKDIRESEKLSEYIQRFLKLKRANLVADYLRSDESRFFNSLVVATYEGEPNWHEFTNVGSKSSLIDLSDLAKGTRSAIGYLSLTGDEVMFALDGQHRLSGMQVALASEKKLGDELVSIILVGHKDTVAGRIRSRHLFSVLNKNAVTISKGERIALDESDVMAITVRKLIEESKVLSEDRIIFRSTDALKETDFRGLTTIGNLYEVLSTLFPKVVERSEINVLKNRRPSDDVLKSYYEAALDYLHLLRNNYPPLNEYFESKSPEKIVSRYRNQDGGHILFRPVGLRIITEVVVNLMGSEELSSAVKIAAKLPSDLSEEPFRDSVWKTVSRTMRPGNRAIARDILLYMLGRKSATDALLRRYAKAIEVEPKDCTLPDPLM